MQVAKERLCLRCGKRFNSSNAGNRICGPCGGATTSKAPSGAMRHNATGRHHRPNTIKNET
jgi:rRNA maturation endonuclease Nob1